MKALDIILQRLIGCITIVIVLKKWCSTRLFIINSFTWNLLLKDCTEVIWKVNANDLLTVPQPEETGMRHSVQAMLSKVRELFHID